VLPAGRKITTICNKKKRNSVNAAFGISSHTCRPFME
jgi:hypothetical protein